MPGTLEHTVALSLFNAQQYINGMFIDTPTQQNKTSESSGILNTVSSLPQSVSNAAYEVLKFVTPTSNQKESLPTGLPGQTYSEVVTGLRYFI